MINKRKLSLQICLFISFVAEESSPNKIFNFANGRTDRLIF